MNTFLYRDSVFKRQCFCLVHTNLYMQFVALKGCVLSHCSRYLACGHKNAISVHEGVTVYLPIKLS